MGAKRMNWNAVLMSALRGAIIGALVGVVLYFVQRKNKR